MKKISSLSLDGLIKDWPEQILAYVAERYPYVMKYKPQVELQQKDDKSRSARGHVILSNSSKTVKLIVLIENAHMFDPDIIDAGNELLPLSSSRIERMLIPATVSAGIASRPQVKSTLSHEYNYPNTYSNYESAMEVLASKLDGTVSRDQVSDLKNSLTKDVGALHKLAGKGPEMISVVKKYLNLSPCGIQSPIAAIIKKAGLNKYVVHTTVIETGKIDKLLLSKQQLDKYANKYGIGTDDGVHQSKYLKGTTFLSKTRDDVVNDTDGFYKVHTSNGVDEGLFVHQSITPNGKFEKCGTFIGSKGYARVDSVNGVKTSTIRSNEIRNGMTGLFKISDDDLSVFVGPVMITKVATVNDTVYVDGIQGLESVKLVLQPGIKKVARVGEQVFIPRNSKFYGTRNTVKIVKPQMTKMAEKVIVLRSDLNGFTLQGPQIDFKGACVDENMTSFALAAEGLIADKIDGLLKEAKKSGMVAIHLNKSTTIANDSITEKIKSLPVNMLKLAFDVSQDQYTLDKVLSVNFITPENIKTFVDRIPDFNDLLKMLTKMLYAVRLGQKSIDEGKLQSTIRGLDKIIDGLKEVAKEIYAREV